MKDWYDLLVMIIDDLGIYIPIGIFLGLIYLLDFVPWKIYLFLFSGMIFANLIKWWWKK